MVLDWHGWCTEHRSDLNGVSIQIRSYSRHLVGKSSPLTRCALRARTESSSAATGDGNERAAEELVRRHEIIASRGLAAVLNDPGLWASEKKKNGVR